MSPYPKAGQTKRPPHYALRLQPSLMAEARQVAKAEGVSLNHFINVCVAEKLSARRAEDYFQEGIRRVECAIALRILDRAALERSSTEPSDPAKGTRRKPDVPPRKTPDVPYTLSLNDP